MDMQSETAITLRLTKAQRVAIQKAADAEGRNVSDYIRRKLFPKPEPKQRKRG